MRERIRPAPVSSWLEIAGREVGEQSSGKVIRHTTRALLGLVATLGLLIGCSDFPGQTSTPTSTAVPPWTNGPILSDARVSISIDYTYYQVNGSTMDDLRSQMDQLGRTDASGHHWDAYTDWYVRWSYPYSRTHDGCVTGPIEVEVEVIYAFPQWDTPEGVSQELVDQWHMYIAALQVHEEGHKEIAVEAGQAVLRALQVLPSYPSCTEVEKAADSAAERVLKWYRQRETEYDRDTEHGATQGVFDLGG